MKHIKRFESFSQEMHDPQTYAVTPASPTGTNNTDDSPGTEPEIVMSKLIKKTKKVKDKIYGDDIGEVEYPWGDSWRWT